MRHQARGSPKRNRVREDYVTAIRARQRSRSRHGGVQRWGQRPGNLWQLISIHGRRVSGRRGRPYGAALGSQSGLGDVLLLVGPPVRHSESESERHGQCVWSLAQDQPGPLLPRATVVLHPTSSPGQVAHVETAMAQVVVFALTMACLVTSSDSGQSAKCKVQSARSKFGCCIGGGIGRGRCCMRQAELVSNEGFGM